jgi:hypothetical protein
VLHARCRPASLIRSPQFFLIAAFTLVYGCVDERTNEAWEYPVRLGITRDSAHALLGVPDPSGPSGRNVDWFPSSGISVNYDASNRVRQINFRGNWGSRDWIPSKSNVVSGITPQTPYAEMVRRLGPPLRTDSTWLQEGYLEHTWRLAGIRLTADVWARDYSDRGVVYSGGTTRFLTAAPAVE